MVSKKIQYRWRQGRLWLSLLLYWLIATAGISIIADHLPNSHEGGWIILVMLVSVSICMITERGHWKVWQRIGFVPLAWVVEAILAPLFAFSIGAFVYASGYPHLVNYVTSFFSSLPIVIFAMWHSRLFVRQKHEIEPNPNQPLPDA